MDDLLKEAIADAKAVRETALANAKMALEEAFTPRLKSMLAKKIQHEIEDEDGDEEVTEDAPLEDEDDEVVPSEEPSAPVSEEDELSDEDKKSIEDVVSNLEEANKGTDVQTIKDRLDELNTVMMEISQKMYQTNEPQSDTGDVEEAEFEEV